MPSIVTAALTALIAVFIFVVGQLLQRFFIEPIQEQRRVIGEIAFSLLFHANASNVSGQVGKGLLQIEDPIEVVKTLRSLAGKLRATLYTVPFYNSFARIRVIPSSDDIKSASQSLVGWSNSIHSGDPSVHRNAIIEHLKIGN